jgi:hypothetical protein
MQKEILNRQTEDDKHKELQQLRKQREKRTKSEKKLERGAGGVGIDSDEELFNITKHSRILKKANFVDVTEEKVEKPKKKEMKFQDHVELEQNLEMIYEDR